MQLKNEDLATAREIKEFLEKNYRNRFDYDYLVQKFHINECKLKHAFKAVTCDNIHSFVTKIRIQHAKSFLEGTDRTIGTIASMVGLNKSNFNIQFKKLTGKTPWQWRNDSLSGNKSSYHNSFSQKKYLQTETNIHGHG